VCKSFFHLKTLLYLLAFTIISFHAMAQDVHVSAGSVQRFSNFPSQYVTPRNIDVWLPDDYSKNKKYAVIYMQDGQMLFDSTNSWNQQSGVWMKPFLS
jgi:enterochelin esterase-like enzyme